jgi:hypothetical protein
MQEVYFIRLMPVSHSSLASALNNTGYPEASCFSCRIICKMKQNHLRFCLARLRKKLYNKQIKVDAHFA